jgi:hypothetical protein
MGTKVIVLLQMGKRVIFKGLFGVASIWGYKEF